RVSGREWRAFAAALLDWAGEDPDLADAPLAVDSYETLPPAKWSTLMPWLRARELIDRLVDPAKVVPPFAELPYGTAPLAPYPTVRARLDPASSPRAALSIREGARAYLAYCAGRREVVARREERMAQPAPTPSVAAARARVGALAASLTRSEPPPPLVAPSLSFSFDEDELRL